MPWCAGRSNFHHLSHPGHGAGDGWRGDWLGDWCYCPTADRAFVIRRIPCHDPARVLLEANRDGRPVRLCHHAGLRGLAAGTSAKRLGGTAVPCLGSSPRRMAKSRLYRLDGGRGASPGSTGLLRDR